MMDVRESMDVFGSTERRLVGMAISTDQGRSGRYSRQHHWKLEKPLLDFDKELGLDCGMQIA